MVVSTGCESADVKQCREQYLKAHELVTNVNTSDLDSVRQALDAVEPTLEACKRASLAEEQDQLISVQRKLESHRTYLEHMQNKKPLTEDELAVLVEKGDPQCPQGTAYMYGKSDKKIRCIGPQIVDMNWKQARAYFEHRSFKLREDGPKLEAESGSVSYKYSFSRAQDNGAARCLKIFSPPGIAWQETLARVTGERPQRIKQGEPVKTASGKRPFTLIEDDVQAILEIGVCD